MEEKRTLRILFIGNSHTYFNDMPAMVAEKARKAGFDCEVTMIAHGGWYLEQHVQEPDVRFNILYGHYDYVVLQEFSHPFGPEEKFFGAVRTLNQWIREAKSKPVIYMTWARKEEQEVQPRMTAANKQIAEEIGALLAPVGETGGLTVRPIQRQRCIMKMERMHQRKVLPLLQIISGRASKKI